MNSRGRFLLLAFLLSTLLIGAVACQATRVASPSPTNLPTATVAPPPLPTPSAIPTVSQTSPPQPSPATISRPFPPLPPNATLPWDSPPLPTLHGRLDDPQALQQALQETSRYDLEVWVATWPDGFPTDVPLPQKGWLVLATREYYPNGDGWSLYLDIPQAADSWKQAYQALLRKQGWKLAPTQGPVLGPGMPEIHWCSPAEDKEILFTLEAIGPKNAIARVSYHPRGTNSTLPCEPQPMIPHPPKDTPKLQPPAGSQATMPEESGGSPGEWTFKRRFSSPQGISTLVEGFSQQLRAQGWEIADQAQAKSAEGEAAVILASKKDASLPHVMLLITGKAPAFDVWLWNGKLGSPPLPPPKPASPPLHGRTDDIPALRRALALSNWSPYMSQRPEIWVATAPSPWLKALPKPPEAKWQSAQHIIYPDGGESWKLLFSVPQSPADARAALSDLLKHAGWKASKLPDMDVNEVGFFPAIRQEEAFDLFCGTGSTDLMAYYTKTASGHTQVMWDFSVGNHTCQASSPWHDTAPASGVPLVRLVLDVQAEGFGGGMSLRGNSDFSKGYDVYSTWWAKAAPSEQIKDLANQLRAGQWQIADEGNLGNVGAWLQAIYTAPNGTAWHADVVITNIGKGYTFGVLRVLPQKP